MAVVTPGGHVRRADRPYISVIVSTFNRVGSLEQAVRSLLAQRIDAPYEVIVVDNGATDGTAQAAQRLVAAGDVRYVFEPHPGLSVARNRGIAEARGDIVAFLDDDAVARPSWLASLIDTYRRHPDAWCVGGKTVLRLPDDRPRWFDPGSPLLSAYLGKLDRGEDVVALRHPDDVWGSNFSIRRDVTARLGGFDPRIGVAGSSHLVGEESELCWRIQRAGGGVYYCGQAVVEHIVSPERLTKRWFRMRARRQGQTDVIVGADGASPVWRAMRCAAVTAFKSTVRALIARGRVDRCRVLEDELAFWRALGRGWQRLLSRGSPVSTSARPAGGVGGG